MSKIMTYSMNDWINSNISFIINFFDAKMPPLYSKFRCDNEYVGFMSVAAVVQKIRYFKLVNKWYITGFDIYESLHLGQHDMTTFSDNI